MCCCGLSASAFASGADDLTVTVSDAMTVAEFNALDARTDQILFLQLAH